MIITKTVELTDKDIALIIGTVSLMNRISDETGITTMRVFEYFGDAINWEDEGAVLGKLHSLDEIAKWG